MNLKLKEESEKLFFDFARVWWVLKDFDLQDIYEDFYDENESREVVDFVNKTMLKKFRKDIENAKIPENIKKDWLFLYKKSSISLKNYDKIIQILVDKPFSWDKKIFEYDKNLLSWDNFLPELHKIVWQASKKMSDFIENEKKNLSNLSQESIKN